jgi:opacity protein-like surface antigen
LIRPVTVNGGADGPIYLDDAGKAVSRSAYATSAVRERRDQWQDRAKITLQYDRDKWFVRPSATLLYYELKTNLRNAVAPFVGYDNYADRYDVNGGVDFGYKVTKPLAVTLAYRYGHQYQQQFAFDAAKLSSPSDYQRVLLGIEGRPWKWLTVALQAGPDFRRYEPDSASHVTPVNDHNPIKYYAEASITIEPTPSDSIAIKYKQYQWVAGTGRVPYFESTYDLAYRRKLTKELALDLGLKVGDSDYTSAGTAAGTSRLRNDYLYTASAGATYAFTPYLSANVGYSYIVGKNAQDGLTQAVNWQREFREQIVAVGATLKF